MAKKPGPPKGKRPPSLGKGSEFERTICKRLSLWWTDGARDDVFWRSAASGARAKQRSKLGQNTFGQYGDIQATDPIGQPLIDLCTIELKRGYNHVTLQDLLDKGPKMVLPPIEQFILQAQQDHENAGSRSWMLVLKRDMRDCLVVVPDQLYRTLLTLGSTLNRCRPSLHLKVCPFQGQLVKGGPVIRFEDNLRAFRMEDFLTHMSPGMGTFRRVATP